MRREETENIHFTEVTNDQERIDCSESIINLIKKTANATLAYENVKIPCEISATIIDNNAIKEINRDFRGIDRPTDVLSFPSGEYPPSDDYFEEDEDVCDEDIPDNDNSDNDPCTNDEFCERPEQTRCFLGDIAISLERAEEQRIEFGHTLEREVSFLTAHSVLHLLGYDHMTAKEEKEMFEKQEEILKTIGQTR